jgi:hypothetical protein
MREMNGGATYPARSENAHKKGRQGSPVGSVRHGARRPKISLYAEKLNGGSVSDDE